MNLIHITHEAVEQKGGIGTVLRGLLTSAAYREGVERTILIGPFQIEPGKKGLGSDAVIHFSSLDGVFESAHSEALQLIETAHNVQIVYGERSLLHPVTGDGASVEIVLVNVEDSEVGPLNRFKSLLWQQFQFDCIRHESEEELDQFIRLAEPGYEAARVLLGKGGPNIFISHDFMGLPLALKVKLESLPSDRTIFHAHEVATARGLVEGRAGHDTMFYNVMRRAAEAGLCLDETFGTQHHYWKHAVFCLVHYLDGIFAVGELVAEEFRFLGEAFRRGNIDCVFNGIPSEKISVEERQRCRSALQDFAEGLTGSRPDFILTHVARPVVSKAIWRDFQVLVQLDPLLEQSGKKATCFLLASEGSIRRTAEEVANMDAEYGWPACHQFGGSDLLGSEEALNDAVQSFNLAARNIQMVFINQFGWGPELCGPRLGADVEFQALRKGTDAEFGLSIYEPFGIAQLEPLTYGAVCVFSNVCGCTAFVEKVDALDSELILVGDYTRVALTGDLAQMIEMDRQQREAIEQKEAGRLAFELSQRLTSCPETLRERIELGHEIASKMNWETVAKEQFLPGIERILI